MWVGYVVQEGIFVSSSIPVPVNISLERLFAITFTFRFRATPTRSHINFSKSIGAFLLIAQMVLSAQMMTPF